MTKKDNLELQLFHGTQRKHKDAICQQGFDWRLSGSHVGTLYGQGSYFAKKASYSDSYTDSGYLFVARVWVGEYTKGMSGMKRPPVKDTNSGQLYDSCVNTSDEKEPEIYVIFTQEQAYPEYIIEYQKKR